MVSAAALNMLNVLLLMVTTIEVSVAEFTFISTKSPGKIPSSKNFSQSLLFRISTM